MATDNLVLNGKSIDTLEEIVENFSPDDMLREFRSGILERWLYNHMEDEKLAEIKSLSQSWQSPLPSPLGSAKPPPDVGDEGIYGI